MLIGAIAALAAPAAARDMLGVFSGWGAFRDAGPPVRCYAIAEPERRARTGQWRPFVSVASWPGRGLRGQLHIRLRHARPRGTPVWLTMGERRFLLVAGRADAWARDPGNDIAIVAAMRSASRLAIESQGDDGRRHSDSYALRGAATAIDAATLGCARG